MNLYGIKDNILKEHERMNINIPINKEKFLEYFKNIILESEKYKLVQKNEDVKYDFPSKETENALNVE